MNDLDLQGIEHLIEAVTAPEWDEPEEVLFSDEEKARLYGVALSCFESDAAELDVIEIALSACEQFLDIDRLHDGIMFALDLADAMEEEAMLCRGLWSVVQMRSTSFITALAWRARWLNRRSDVLVLE